MTFKDDKHEEKFGEILYQVVRQGPLYRAVYYLIALTHLPFGACYDEEKNEIRAEALQSEDIDNGELGAIRLAHDILCANKGIESKKFDVWGYDRESEIYYLEALREYPDYFWLKYAKVYLIARDGTIIERYRFPHVNQAIIYVRFITANALSPNYQIQVLWGDEDITHVVGLAAPSKGSLTQHKLTSMEIEGLKRRTELLIRYQGLCLPVEHTQPSYQMDWWPN